MIHNLIFGQKKSLKLQSNKKSTKLDLTQTARFSLAQIHKNQQKIYQVGFGSNFKGRSGPLHDQSWG